MARQQTKKQSNLATIYLIILFVVGIIVGLTLQNNNNIINNIKQQKHKIENKQQKVKLQEINSEQVTVKKDNKVNSIVQKLENELITVLVTNNISQKDIITQYAKEVTDNKLTYIQYYKQIYLPKNKKIDPFDSQFKTLSRNCEIKFSKVVDNNLGTYTYSFYDKNRVYSIVVFKESDKK